MCFNPCHTMFFRTSVRSLALLMVAVITALAVSCGSPGLDRGSTTLTYTDGRENKNVLVHRFAPKLILHSEEPYEIIAAIPVCHPSKPIIAYHVFFEHDAVLFSGQSADHEILWVQYDPVTLKVSDVSTLWHRTVIRTDDCLLEAKGNDQRPSVFVQWGQHGLLPFGWESLMSVRPRLEFAAHYNLVSNLNRLPKFGSRRSAVVFEGSYEDYKRFSRLVDLRTFISERDVIVAEYSENGLRSRLPKNTEFKVKKEWPDW